MDFTDAFSNLTGIRGRGDHSIRIGSHVIKYNKVDGHCVICRILDTHEEKHVPISCETKILYKVEIEATQEFRDA